MHKQLGWSLPVVILVLASCGPSEITNYDTIEKIVRRANQKYAEAKEQFSASLSILDAPDEQYQEQQLKNIVLRKNKEWNQKDWFAFSWRGMATGLQGYKNFPFHTYKDYVDQYLKALKRSWNRLSLINAVDVSTIKNNIDALIKKLSELSDIIEAHDRYLAETDKMGLILTRQKNRPPSLFDRLATDI